MKYFWDKVDNKYTPCNLSEAHTIIRHLKDENKYYPLALELVRKYGRDLWQNDEYNPSRLEALVRRNVLKKRVSSQDKTYYRVHPLIVRRLQKVL